MTPLSNYPLYLRPGKFIFRLLVSMRRIRLPALSLVRTLSSTMNDAEFVSADRSFWNYRSIAAKYSQDYALASSFRDLSSDFDYGALLYSGSVLSERGYCDYASDLIRLVPLEISCRLVPLIVLRLGLVESNGGSSDRFWSIVCRHLSAFDCTTIARLVSCSLSCPNVTLIEHLMQGLRSKNPPQSVIANAIASVGLVLDSEVASAAVKANYRMGIISYRSPETNSINIGDYVQTAAYLGCLARTKHKEVVGGGAAAFQEVQPLCESSRVSNAAVDMFEFYRDCSMLNNSPKGVKSYFPVFGWHMRSVFGDYDMNYGENCIPFFFSVHVNVNQMLTPHVVSVLQKYSPIGCRDINSLRLLRSHDVPSFFSGCVTKTIGENFSKLTNRSRDLVKVSGVYEDKAHKIKNSKRIIHTNDMLPLSSLKDGVISAIDLLQVYSRAEENRTDLLHSYLPSRSLGCRTTFTHHNLADNRFEGLINVSDEAFKRNSERLLDLLDETHKFIDEKVPSEAAFRSFWGQATEYLCALSDQLLDEQRSVALKTLVDCESSVRKALRNLQPIESVAGRVIVLCCDKSWAKHTTRLIGKISESSEGALTIVVLTRNCEVLLPEVREGLVCEQLRVDSFQFKGISLLKHTSISTMDRLLIPRLLPNAQSCVYLDVDIEIHGTVDELIDYDMQGFLFAARESIEPKWSDMRNVIDSLLNRKGMEEASSTRNLLFACCQFKSKMFNAGVLKMNLAKIRELDADERMIAVSQLTGFNDQYSMNIFADGDYLPLPKRFNYFFNRETAPICKNSITHYVGNFKPWNK